MPERYFQINRSDIAYFRFILEAYEGLATLSTLDARKGTVVLSIPGDFVDDVDSLLAALGEEIMMTEIDNPVGAPFFTRQEADDGAR
ncbi:MAG: DUF4911 domain-containing protein [Geobacteraceae bacterium]|nr:DUF4911 domain-containing protein [Geobacteraceae bacterium]